MLYNNRRGCSILWSIFLILFCQQLQTVRSETQSDASYRLVNVFNEESNNEGVKLFAVHNNDTHFGVSWEKRPKRTVEHSGQDGTTTGKGEPHVKEIVSTPMPKFTTSVTTTTTKRKTTSSTKTTTTTTKTATTRRTTSTVPSTKTTNTARKVARGVSTQTTRAPQRTYTTKAKSKTSSVQNTKVSNQNVPGTVNGQRVAASNNRGSAIKSTTRQGGDTAVTTTMAPVSSMVGGSRSTTKARPKKETSAIARQKGQDQGANSIGTPLTPTKTPTIASTISSRATTANKKASEQPRVKDIFVATDGLAERRSFNWKKPAQGVLVELERNIPSTVSVNGAEGTFVCFEKPADESGCVSSHDLTTYTPRAPIGQNGTVPIYYTNTSRSTVANTTLTVISKQSTNPKLRLIEVTPGRLDPQFSPSQYDYLARLPRLATSFNLHVGALDERNTTIWVRGKKYGGNVKPAVITVPFSLSKNAESVGIQTLSSDGKSSIRYLVTGVRQLGGSTLLKGLTPAIGQLGRGFDPFVGDYVLSNAFEEGRGSDLSWVAFSAEAANKKAEVTIDGIKFDPKTGMSPYLRVPLGEKRRFTIAVRTSENPVAEEYHVTVDRSAEGPTAQNSWPAGSILGYISSAVTAHTGTAFLQNAKWLQYISFTNRVAGNAESYDAFAAGLHLPFNAQGYLKDRVQFLNGTERLVLDKPTVGSNAPSLTVGSSHGEYVPPYQLRQNGYGQLAEVSRDLATSLMMHSFDSNSQSWQKLDVDHVAAHIQRIAGSALADHRDANTIEPSIVRYLTAIKDTSNVALMDQRQQIVAALDARMKKESMLREYVSALMVNTAVVVLIALGYVVVWFTYLRRPGGKMVEMRPDFPSVLHPVRFWSFVFDFALVMFSQTSLGLLFLKTPPNSLNLSFYGIVMNRNMIFGTSLGVFLLFPLTYLVCAAYCLFKLKSQLVYSQSLCEYHDPVCREAKALYNALSWVPLFSSLFQVEIHGVFPIVRSVQDHGDQRLTFTHDNTPLSVPLFSANPNDATERRIQDQETGYKPLAGATNRNSCHWDHENDAFRAELDDLSYASNQYDNKNASLFRKWPSATVASKSYMISSPYDAPMRAEVAIQMKHLTSLVQVVDKYSVYVPRPNMLFKQMDRFRNFYGNKVGRGNPYYWLMDRLSLIVIVALVSCWEQPKGYTHLMAALGMSILMATSYLPSSIASAATKWARWMNVREENNQKKQQQKVQEENMMQVWPFQHMGMHQRLLDLRQHKHDMKYYGSGGIFRKMLAPIWKIAAADFWWTRFWLTVVEVFTGAVGQEIFRIALLWTLVMTNRNIARVGPASGSMIGIALSYIAAGFLNNGALECFFRNICHSAKAIGHGLQHTTLSISCAVADYRSAIERMKFYTTRVGEVLRGRKNVSFHFPSVGSRIRDFNVKHMTIISNELGIHLPGELKTSEEGRSAQEKAGHFERRRYDMHKTLYVSEPLGVHRRDLDQNLPIQMPFKHFYSSEGKTGQHPQRLVATIQVANHGIRNAGSTRHTSDDDSFLSLYTDPRLVSAFGDIKIKSKGHGYSVRYDSVSQALCVKGPSLHEGTRYHLTTASSVPKGGKEDSSSSSSSSDSTEKIQVGRRVTVTGQCSVPGFLRLVVEKGMSPNLYKHFDVRNPRNETFTIDPREIKVLYDPVGRELFLRHRGFYDSTSPFQISWTTRDFSTAKVNSTARCEQDGVAYFPLEGDTLPDLQSWMTLRDENNACVDIDPTQTDLYQFSMPEQTYHGPGKVLYHLTRRIQNLLYWTLGRPGVAHGVVEEPVPCTIVQCVNPIDQVYRVDPNFQEIIKIFNARINDLEAKYDRLDSRQSLQAVWPSMMTNSDFLHFWKKQGVKCVTSQGFVNPLTERDHLHFQHHLETIDKAEGTFKMELQKLIKARINRLEQNLSRMRIWDRAYNDTHLYKLQLERDAADWHKRSAEASRMNAQLRELKKPYENELSNFMYPMSLQGTSLCRKPNVPTQLCKWQRELEHWLTTEEAILARSNSAEGISNLHAIVVDVMHALRMTSYRPENPAAGVYRTVLHYVCGSQMLRGAVQPWRPDPLCAHTALVRVWRCDPNGKANFSKDPFWLPCALKLTGSAVKIMMPNQVDYERKFPSPHSWQQVTGWYVPLAAFQKVDVLKQNHLPAGAASNLMLKGMTGELVFRKNQQFRVDDHYVLRIEDDEFDNVIKFGDYGKPDLYRLMIGHCVPMEYAGNFPTMEQDKSIQSYSGEVNVMPLTLRINEAYIPRWRSVIETYKMYQPHSDYIDGVVRLRYEHQDIPKEEQPVEDVSTSSTSPRVDPTPTPVHTEEPGSPIRPAPEMRHGKYHGDFPGDRYHGKGSLYDRYGTCAYKGEWCNGLRWGRGVSFFKDSSGIQWKYDGNWVSDCPHGEGSLELCDDDELSRLASSGNVEDKKAILRFKGTFRSDVTETHKPQATESPVHHLLRKGLFSHAPAGSDDSSSSLLSDEHSQRKKLNLDFYQASDYAKKAGLPSVTHEDVDEAMRAGIDANEEVLKAVREYLPNTFWRDNVEAVMNKFTGGIITYANGQVSTGSGRNWFHNGHGRLLCPSCPMLLEGQFVDEKPHGKVVMTSGRGDAAVTFWGNMNAGVRNGHGVLQAEGKRVFIEGTWENDILEGKILVHIHRDAAHSYPFRRFVGTLRSGLPEGEAKVIYPNGDWYKGNFRQGLRDGQGELRNKNNQILSFGTWTNDKFHGRAGRLQLPDSTIYSGDVVDGKRQGMGELYGPDGLIYEGLWNNDTYHGRGTLYCSDGVYDGEFKQGKRHGKGRFVYKEKPLANGKQRVYQGDWVNGKPHGTGKYLNENGVENVYKFVAGRISPESAKAYKKGLCGKAPEFVASADVKDPPISPQQADPDKDHKIDFNSVALWKLDQAWWSRHCSHEYSRMEPVTATDFPRLHSKPPASPLSNAGSWKSASSDARVLSEDSSQQSLDLRQAPHVMVTVHSVTELEVGDNSDPYIVVKIGAKERSTSVKHGAGRNCYFDETFVLPYKNEEELTVLAMERDTVTRDDRIGQAQLKLSPGFTHSGQLQLTNEKNKTAGSVDITLEVIASSM